jgi:hypothetical protein
VGAIDDKLTFTVDEGKPVSYTRREVRTCTLLGFSRSGPGLFVGCADLRRGGGQARQLHTPGGAEP